MSSMAARPLNAAPRTRARTQPVTAPEVKAEVIELREDHDALRDALFGPDPYQPAGILTALSTNVARLQTTVEQLPETMTTAIRAERTSRAAHKLAGWQKIALIFGCFTGVIMAGGTVYEVTVGLSHSLFTTTPVVTDPVHSPAVTPTP